MSPLHGSGPDRGEPKEPVARASTRDASAPDIAVIIPTRNRLRALRKAIDSVFTQTYQNFELIVIDDCSSDGTEAYLASIADPRLKWFRFDQWRNQNAARNHGVAMSKAPILTLLDSDDLYLPHRLAETIAFFRDNPKLDVRLSSFTFVAGEKSEDLINLEGALSRADIEHYVIGVCLNLGGSAIAMRRQVFEEAGGYDETVLRMTDREFLLCVARKCGCYSTANIDWIKNRSPDSVSNPSAGRITALNAMCERHPVMLQKYPVLFRYLVAREIVKPLLNLRLRRVRAALTEASNHPRTRMPVWKVLSHYQRGRRQRHALRKEIAARWGASSAESDSP
jgi:glycosyltransferase involved in cell wall biosynthesis